MMMAHFRAPFLPSEHLVENMDRAEFLHYLRTREMPRRLSFVPRAVGAEGHCGSGFVVDIGLTEDRLGSLEALMMMDATRLHVTSRCMYEHMRVRDEDGYIAVGMLQCITAMLSQLVASAPGITSSEMGAVFHRFVVCDLQLRNLMQVNSGEFRDVCESIFTNSGRRSIAALASGLELDVTLGGALPDAIFHRRLDAETLKGLISGTVHPATCEPGLHAVIAYSGEGDQMHHFLAVWYVGETVLKTVD